MKRLQIYITGNKATRVGDLAERLKDSAKALKGDFQHLDFVPVECDTDHPLYLQDFAAAKPDMLIVDQFTSDRLSRDTKTRFPFMPILLMPIGSVSQKYRASLRAQSERMPDDSKVFDGIIDPSESTSEPLSVIRKVLRKDLKIAVIGLSMFGRQSLKIYARANEVREVRGYSEHTPYDVVTASLDHLGARKDKVRLFSSLEEAIQGTDAVLVSTSAIRTSSLEDKLAKTENRFDLLELEAKKLQGYFRRFVEAGYQGLVVPIENAVGPILALGRNAGLDPGQITSPLDIDHARVYDAVREDLGADYRIFMDAVIKGAVIFEHGIPEFAPLNEAPRDQDKNLNGEKSFYQRLYETVQESIRRSVIRAREMPIEALRNKPLLEERSYEAAYEAANFFFRLARLDPTPNISAYCHFRVNGEYGFLGLPIRVEYFPEIRIKPNNEVIGQFDPETKQKLKDQIALQNMSIKPYSA